MSSLVSIIIPAYNCEQTISQVLDCVFQQSYQPIEVIVVDDGSSDKSAELIKRYNQVRYFHQTNAGPAKARNKGAAMAKGDVIFFTDSDCFADQDWIKNAMIYFNHKKADVVAGSYGIANPESTLALCVHQEIIYRHQYLMGEKTVVFGSYNVGMRKSIFKQVGGFDESYLHASGEDNDLSYKITKKGYEMYFCLDAIVRHNHPSSVKKYLQEQFRHGFWRAWLYKTHPNMVGGDQYTFWKDMLEVPFSLLICMSIIYGIFVNSSLGFIGGASISLCLLMIELYYSWIMQKKKRKLFFYGFVMFMRAFARTFGFSTGIINVFAKNLLKKAK